MPPMDLIAVSEAVFAAPRPWHFWLGLVLVISAVAVTLALGVGYLIKVTAARYPRD